MKHLPNAILIFVCSLSFWTHFAHANDSTAVIAAGGLVLQKSNELNIISEKLRIGPSRISVDYEIQNLTAKAVSTTIAFPLPLLEGPMIANTPIDFSDKNVENFVDFSTSIDGTVVQPKQQIKAYQINKDGAIGTDVTSIIRSAGILMAPLRRDFYDRVADLPDDKKSLLVKNGLLLVEEIGSNKNYLPLWGVEFTYFSDHVFEPGKVVRVHHEYLPVVGRSLFGSFSMSEDLSKWCFDDTTKKGVAKLVASRPIHAGWEKAVDRKQVDYILKTGANWAGPIGTFELIIDKEKAENLTSLCFEGLKKISKTEFRAVRTDYIPTVDLSVLFFVPF